MGLAVTIGLCIFGHGVGRLDRVRMWGVGDGEGQSDTEVGVVDFTFWGLLSQNGLIYIRQWDRSDLLWGGEVWVIVGRV